MTNPSPQQNSSWKVSKKYSIWRTKSSEITTE